MKLSFEKDHLMNGINIVLKAVPSKTTMPILECILIDAVSDEIKLTGNDIGCFADPAKLVLIFDMLAGRLEIFPMLVLFMPDTWRRF